MPSRGFSLWLVPPKWPRMKQLSFRLSSGIPSRIGRVVRSALTWIRCMWDYIKESWLCMAKTWNRTQGRAPWTYDHRLQVFVWSQNEKCNAELSRVESNYRGHAFKRAVQRWYGVQVDFHSHHVGRLPHKEHGCNVSQNCFTNGEISDLWRRLYTPTKLK